MAIERSKKAFIFSHNHTDFLKPVLSYKTKIVQIKKVNKKEKIGYGRAYSANNQMTVAIIPVGYAEGLSRGLSNPGGCGQVLINEQKCPIIGRVCMNMSIIDITKLKTKDYPPAGGLKTDEVILIGKQGDEEITIEDWANKIGTINYELTTNIPESIMRIYI